MKLPHTEITIRALKDPRFRKRLQAKPRKAIEETFDIRVPKSVKLKVVEDNPELVHLIVPSEPGERGKEIGIIGLTLDQMRSDPAFKATVIDDPKGTLEQMTGGRCPTTRGHRAGGHGGPRPPASAARQRGQKLRRRPCYSDVEVYGGWRRPIRWPRPEPTTDGPDCTSLAGNNSSLGGLLRNRHHPTRSRPGIAVRRTSRPTARAPHSVLGRHLNVISAARPPVQRGVGHRARTRPQPVALTGTLGDLLRVAAGGAPRHCSRPDRMKNVLRLADQLPPTPAAGFERTLGRDLWRSTSRPVPAGGSVRDGPDRSARSGHLDALGWSGCPGPAPRARQPGEPLAGQVAEVWLEFDTSRGDASPRSSRPRPPRTVSPTWSWRYAGRRAAPTRASVLATIDALRDLPGRVFALGPDARASR